MALKITKNYLTNNDCYRSGRTINPIGIQIHTIGTAQNTAQALANFWNSPGKDVCVHYCVDAEVEGKVLQFLPDNYRSWADAGWGNNSLITIEGMESDYMKYLGGATYRVLDDAKFKADIRRSYNGLVMLCTKICKDRGWNPMTKFSNGMYLISSHMEGNKAGLSSNHSDPDHVWKALGYTMDGFRKAVKAALGGGTVPSNKRKMTKDCTYTVANGDTLFAIANDLGVSLKRLKNWNGLKSDLIKRGQVLKIYKSEAVVTTKYGYIRNKPAKDLIKRVEKGTKLKVRSYKNVVVDGKKVKWARIWYDGKKAWIKANRIKEV